MNMKNHCDCIRDCLEVAEKTFAKEDFDTCLKLVAQAYSLTRGLIDEVYVAMNDACISQESPGENET